MLGLNPLDSSACLKVSLGSPLSYSGYLFVYLLRFGMLTGGHFGAVISEDMVIDGYQDIVNIDISQVVIDAMIAKYKDMPQLQCNILAL